MIIILTSLIDKINHKINNLRFLVLRFIIEIIKEQNVLNESITSFIAVRAPCLKNRRT